SWLARRRGGARGGEQHGCVHRARADAQPRHPKLEFRGGTARWIPDPRTRPGTHAVYPAWRSRAWAVYRTARREHRDADHWLPDHGSLHLAGQPAEAIP